MSRTTSPSAGRPYGVDTACRRARFEARQRRELHLEGIPERNSVLRDREFPIPRAPASGQRRGGAVHPDTQGAERAWQGLCELAGTAGGTGQDRRTLQRTLARAEAWAQDTELG